MPEEKGKGKESKRKEAMESAAKAVQQAGQRQMESAEKADEARSSQPSPNTGRTAQADSYKRGGKVKRGGRAVLHKGEKLKRKKGKRYRGRL